MRVNVSPASLAFKHAILPFCLSRCRHWLFPQPATNIVLWHIPHSVTIKPGGNAVRLSWPAAGTNFLLEASEDLQQGNWAEVSQPPVVEGEECVVTNDMSAPSAFYRLRRKAW